MMEVYDGFVSYLFFFFKQKTAYEMRISDWSSDLCSSDLQCLGCRCRSDIAAHDLNFRIVFLDPAHTFYDAGGMAMGRIDDNDIDAGIGQLLDALLGALAHAHRAADPQLPLGVLAGHGMFRILDDIFYRRQPAHLELVLFDQDPFQPVLVPQGLRFVERGALRSEERRVGKECVRKCRFRWSRYH